MLNKRLQHKCFPVNFAKFLSIPLFKDNLRWLIIDIYSSAWNTSDCFLFKNICWKTTATKMFQIKSVTYIKLPIFTETDVIHTLWWLKYLLLFSGLNHKNNDLSTSISLIDFVYLFTLIHFTSTAPDAFRRYRNEILGNEFIKKRLQHRCFPLNKVEFLRTPTLKNICERLLLSTKSSKANSHF